MKRSPKTLPIAHFRLLYSVGFLLNTSVLPENMADARVVSRKVTLFHQEAPGAITYRIPALLFLPNKSVFLAFAEKRSSPKDEHSMYLVMRRGHKKGTSVQWDPQSDLMSATIPGHRTMNPCPVYEKRSGKVFLFFICVWSNVTGWSQITTGKDFARLCYVSSPDGGHTWSQLTDLTDQVIGDDLRDWATFGVGPGHGVQLRSGRLVIPAYTYYTPRHLSSKPVIYLTRPHCFVFYSDDGGQNWARGQLVRSFQMEECQVAELTRQDDSQVLYCNARSPEKYRVEAFSTDDGNQFEEPFFCKKLPETGRGCQGSVVSFTSLLKPSEMGRRAKTVEPTHPLGVRPSTALNTTKEWLLFSHPTGRSKRVNLGIYLNTSPLVKGSWKDPWVLNEGPSGYSDLAVCEENRPLLFGCLFESGETTEHEEIAFRLFTSVELQKNTRGKPM